MTVVPPAARLYSLLLVAGVDGAAAIETANMSVNLTHFSAFIFSFLPLLPH